MLPITEQFLELIDTVSVNLGEASSFGSFHRNDLELKFHGASLTSEDEGTFLFYIKVRTKSGQEIILFQRIDVICDVPCMWDF